MLVRTAAVTTVATAALGIAWWKRWLLRRHGVVLTFAGYCRMLYRLRGGWKKLMVISDFDRTITTAACGISCHGVVESCQELSLAYRTGTQKLVSLRR